MTQEISLREVVGGGYKEFWNFKGRYRVVKGSRGSKKSKTTALWYIVNMIKYPTANLLVVRKTFRTLSSSCFKELVWATKRIGVEQFWKITQSPLQMEYLPTGQTIQFRGLDDPLKVTSITVDMGCLCWLWIEEAYEIMKEPYFDMLNESIRGAVDDGLFKQTTLTFNPWNEHHWIKARFFDAPPDPDILAITTNYTCNEFLDQADIKLFDYMKTNNPRRYQVAGLGNWGIVDGLVYENWREADFDLMEVRKQSGIKTAFGLDFGYTNDPTAFFCGLVSEREKKIYVFDELYKKAMSNEEIYEAIAKAGYSKEKIVADSAEPKSIARLRDLGLARISAARKGKDSVMHGIDFISDYEIIVHPSCCNFLTEISNYTWDEDGFGKKINQPLDDFNHLMDAMRYALEDFSKGEVFSFN